MKKIRIILTVLLLTVVIAACRNTAQSDGTSTEPECLEQSIPESEETSTDREIHHTEPTDTETIVEVVSAEEADQEESSDMVVKIGETPVQVIWEDNEAVASLRQLADESPLVIGMSMYGGFEQVGSIGQSLPRDDEQITTKVGDIVLYSGNQLVVFYGSNSWEYTRLGHISDKNEKELTELLGNEDVTITIEY